MKVNASGTKVWDNTVTGSSKVSAESVCPTSDGGFIVSGGEFGLALLWKFTSTGTLSWTKSFPNEAFGLSVRETSDGGYVFITTTTTLGPGNKDIYLIKTNSSGTMTGYYYYGTATDDEVGVSVLETSNGGYLLLGTTGRYPSKIITVKINESDLLQPK